MISQCNTSNKTVHQFEDAAPARSMTSPSNSEPGAMSTAALVNRLQHLEPSRQPKQSLYQAIAQHCLELTFQLVPQTPNWPEIPLRLKTLVNGLGPSLEIKGSAVPMLLKTRKLDWNKLNDLDLAMPMARFQGQHFKENLAHLITQHKAFSPHHRDQFNTEEVMAAYCRNVVANDRFIKVRFNVAQSSTPIDLLAYDVLVAEFDQLAASNKITVDLPGKTASVQQLVDLKTIDWLNKNKLLWLHESMEGGLIRVQKHFDQHPHRLLQPPPIIKQIYSRDTVEHQAGFITWLYRSRLPLSKTKPLIESAAQAIAQTMFGNQVSAHAFSEQYPALYANMKQSQKNQADPLLFTTELIKCLKLFPVCAFEFQHYLLNNQFLLQSARDCIDECFQAVSPADLVHYYLSPEAENYPQIKALLDPLLNFYHNLERLPAAEKKDVAIAWSLSQPLTCQIDTAHDWFTNATSTPLSEKVVLKRLEKSLSRMKTSFLEDSTLTSRLDRLAAILTHKQMAHLPSLITTIPLARIATLSSTSPNIAALALGHQIETVLASTQQELNKAKTFDDGMHLMQPLLEIIDNYPAPYFVYGGQGFINNDIKYLGGLKDRDTQIPAFTDQGLFVNKETRMIATGIFHRNKLSQGQAIILLANGRIDVPEQSIVLSKNKVSDQDNEHIFRSRLNGDITYRLQGHLPETRQICAQLQPYMHGSPLLTEHIHLVFHGQWQGTLHQFIQNPFQQVHHAECSIKTASDQPDGQEYLALQLQDKSLDSVTVHNFEGQASQSLTLYKDPDSDTNSFLDTITLKKKTQHHTFEISAHWDHQQQKIVGPAILKSEIGKLTGPMEHTNINGTYLCQTEDQPNGYKVKFIHNALRDEALEALSQSGNISTHRISQSIKPFYLPNKNDDLCLFSYLSTNDNEFCGIYSRGLYHGTFKTPQDEIMGRFSLVTPEQVSFLSRINEFALIENTPTIKSILDLIRNPLDTRITSLSLVDGQGQLLKLLPMTQTIREQRQGESIIKIFNFGRPLPKCKIRYSDGSGDIYQLKDKPSWFVYISFDSKVVMMPLLDQYSHPLCIATPSDFAQGEFGIITTPTECYFGELKQMKPHGQGRRIHQDFSRIEAGRFHFGQLQFGRIVFTNQVALVTHWDKYGVHGITHLEVPTQDGVITLKGRMHRDRLVTDFSNEKTGTAKITIKPCHINEALHQFDLGLSTEELQHLAPE